MYVITGQSKILQVLTLSLLAATDFTYVTSAVHDQPSNLCHLIMVCTVLYSVVHNLKLSLKMLNNFIQIERWAVIWQDKALINVRFAALYKWSGVICCLFFSMCYMQK
jgi:hypothetical protein